MAAPGASQMGTFCRVRRARGNHQIGNRRCEHNGEDCQNGDRKKMMDTNKSTDCPRCSKPTRIVKRVKDRERGIPGGVYISCSVCEFFEKL